jgi:hypothetical protein
MLSSASGQGFDLAPDKFDSHPKWRALCSQLLVGRNALDLHAVICKAFVGLS